MSVDVNAYTISVRKDEFDGEELYEARVKELPDIIEYADSFEEAYDLAVDTIETTAAHFAEIGRSLPPPTVPADDYSGRVTLRLPRSLHRALVEVAECEGVSLNQHMVGILTYFSGFAQGQKTAFSGTWITMTPTEAGRTKKVMGRHLKLIHSSEPELTTIYGTW